MPKIVDALPEDIHRAKGIWVMRRIEREEMDALGPRLVAQAIDEQEALWPLYLFFAEAPEHLGPAGAI